MSTRPEIETTAIRVDAATRRRVEEYSRKLGMSQSEIVQKALEEFTVSRGGVPAEKVQETTAFDILSHLGLIGCLESPPESETDLATNPKHMTGFGGR